MNLLAWGKKKCIALTEETLHERKAEVFAYIRANPNKIYLLPDDQGFFDEDLSIRVAQEIEFPCPLKLISPAGDFEVESLSDALDAISYDENFLPAGKNFLIVPQDFISVANAIKRQCSILQVPLEICSEKDFSTLATEQKLMDNAANLLSELAVVKQLRENISCLEEFLSASKDLENFLRKSNAATKLLFAGDPNERELLSEIFGRLNFEAEIIAETDLAAKLPNADACLFALDALNTNFARAENFLQTVAHLPDKEKILFVMIRPALREQETTENFSRILLDFAKILDARGFEASPIFPLDAPEIFYCREVSTLLANADEPLTVNELAEVLGLKGRDEFLTRRSLEKIFEPLPNPSSQSLLQKSGVPYLENYLRQSLKKNPSGTEKLLCRVERAVSFLEDDSLQNIRLGQIKNLSAAARQAEFSHEKILAIATQEQTVSGDAIIKAILYDVNRAIDSFLSAINALIRELWEELTASEEFSAEKLVALHRGKISAELKNLLDDTQARLQDEYAEQSRKLFAQTKKILNDHRTQAKKFVDDVRLTAQLFSETPYQEATLPVPKIFDAPPFDAGLSENFSAEKISRLIKRCTRILCVREVEQDWAFFVNNRGQLLKTFHLAGTFRRELRLHLSATAQDNLNALEKNLRQKISAATIEYFAQVSRICRTQRELCLNAFRLHVDDIFNRLDAVNKDFAVLRQISSSLKNFREFWRLICPKQNRQIFVEDNFSGDLLTEMAERKARLINLPLNDAGDLSTEKFLPDEKPDHHSGASDELFSLGKTAFLNKKYENAFKIFSRAAAKGNIEAIKYLAYMHQNGLGTPKNIYTAIGNYLDAFSLGDNVSADELREIFQNLKCYSHALEWFQTFTISAR